MYLATAPFAKDFGLNILRVIEKVEGESPTPKELEEIMNEIKEFDVKTIFVEPDSSTRVANTIAEECKITVNTLDSITSGNGKLDDYENRMRKNIKILKESL